MRKIFTIILTLILCFALSACSCSNKRQDNNLDSQTDSSREVGGEYLWD